MPSHMSLVEPFGPEWPSCRQIFARECSCTKSTMVFHAGYVFGQIHSGAAGRDAAVARDARHLREDESGAAERASSEVYEMKRLRRSVDSAVHVHRRDDDAVGELALAQTKGDEHRRNDAASEPSLDSIDVTSCRVGADSRDRSAGCASGGYRRTASGGSVA